MAQALMQCSDFLDEHRDWNRISLKNTAFSAKKVKDEGDISQAAIASHISADIYGLEVLENRIQDNKNNATRFIIVSGKKICRKGSDRISICFETPHKSGALYHMLAHFIYNGVNMLNIQSRPISGKAWEYRFFVDFEGRFSDTAVQNAKAFHEETVRKLSKLHLYDCLRANKSLSAWGVEGRVPFLDKEFLDTAMRTNPEAKMCPGNVIEKKIVREAFADMLPEEVAWRQKEQFSDGVGYSWIDTLKKITSDMVSDEDMANAAERFPINPPRNKEEYYYRSIFAEHFPSDSAARSVPSVPSVACSTAEALAWDETFRNMNDPSGRAVAGVHEKAY